MIYDDEENTILALKKFLAYLPSNNVENPPVVADDGQHRMSMKNFAILFPMIRTRHMM